uniref:Uncharacterized protein n=1 Tax=Helianthus annuus TaxID=4232 RepID=A0A251UZE9_HELAN
MKMDHVTFFIRVVLCSLLSRIVLIPGYNITIPPHPSPSASPIFSYIPFNSMCPSLPFNFKLY